MCFPLEEWAPAFALTVVSEVVVVLLALHDIGVSPLRLALLCLFANLATHPVVWFVITQLLLPGTLAFTAVAEGWASGPRPFYWAALPGVRVRRLVLVSVLANATSFALGRLIRGMLAGPA